MNGFHFERLLGATRLAASQGVSFGLARNVIPIALWQGIGKNLTTVSGALALDGKPVSGATIAVDQYLLPEPTAADGGFHVLLDQTTLSRRVLRVADAANGKVDGRALSTSQRAQLTKANFPMNIAFEIALDGTPVLRKGEKDARITGHLSFSDKKTPVPPVALWDYVIRGVIRDAQGNPVENALASISGNGGEASAISAPTDKTGEYTLHFYPQAGDDFDVRVGYGLTLYTSAMPMSFAPGKSVSMDLVLPASGEELKGTGANGMLEPKELAGAEYIGVLVGLAAGGAPIDAKLTWPDAKGAFAISIPTVDFAGPVSFYQAQLRFFSTDKQSPGGAVSGHAAPVKFGATMPRDLQPLSIAG